MISFFAKCTYLLEMNSYEYQCVFQPSAVTAMKTDTKPPWPHDRERNSYFLSVSHTHIGPLPSPWSNVTKWEEDPQKIGVTHSLTHSIGWVACSLIHWTDGQPSNFCSCPPREGTRGKIHGHLGLYPLQQKITIVHDFCIKKIVTLPNTNIAKEN